MTKKKPRIPEANPVEEAENAEQLADKMLDQHKGLLTELRIYCETHKLDMVIFLGNGESGACLWNGIDPERIPYVLDQTMQGLRTLSVESGIAKSLPRYLKRALCPPMQHEISDMKREAAEAAKPKFKMQ